MTLTLLALLMLPLEMKMVLDPSGMRRTLKDWGNSEGLQFFSSMVLLMLALLIFTTSEIQFKWAWESVLTWFAVLTVLEAITTLMPAFNKWKVKMLSEERLPVVGFFTMLLSLGMIYLDTQVL